jgi:hypothetical protein
MVVPSVRAVAAPRDPGAFEIDATVSDDDAQRVSSVTSRIDWSLNVPVAVSCRVWPFGSLGFAGVTAIDTSSASVTVKATVPVIVPLCAVIVDRFGTPLAVAGALTEDEVRQILGPLINRIAREAVRTRRTTIVG